MSMENVSDNFKFMEMDSLKSNPRQKCVLCFLVLGVILSLLLSVISLSVVLTKYKVEIHVNPGESGSGSPQANALVVNQKKLLKKKIKLARLENSDDKQANCSMHGGRYATQYKLTVHVGHVQDANTDHNIYARLFGEYGSCGRFLLETPIDNFQLGAEDEFLLTCEEAIGELKSVEMTNEGTDGLYMEGLVIVNLANQREYDLPCECWIDDAAGEGLLSRNLTVARHCTKVDL